MNFVEQEAGDTTVSVAVKVSKGIDETNELSKIRPLSVVSLTSSFCELCE